MAPSAPLQLSGAALAATALFGLFALATGVALLVDAARRLRFQRRARTAFERVDARVVDSAVAEPVTGGTEAVPEVEYEYAVDGETYRSRSLWPTRSESPGRVDRAVARRVVEDYPVDAEVIARYDPEEPGRSFLLEQFDSTGERVELVAGTLLVALAVGLAVLLGRFA